MMPVTLNPHSQPMVLRFAAASEPDSGESVDPDVIAASAAEIGASAASSGEPGFFERLDGLAQRVKEFVELFSETLAMAKKGFTDAVSVVKNLPRWESLLQEADPEGNNTAVERLKSVLDVTMAEFRSGYTNAAEQGSDMANFALYSGVLKRFPGLAALQDNDLAAVVLEGALANNPFRPADEAREALDELLTAPETEGLSITQVEEALGIPLDIGPADLDQADVQDDQDDVTNPETSFDSQA